MDKYNDGKGSLACFGRLGGTSEAREELGEMLSGGFGAPCDNVNDDEESVACFGRLGGQNEARKHLDMLLSGGFGALTDNAKYVGGKCGLLRAA